MLHKIEFLYKSIEDTQATIRAIDTKLGFIFIVLVIPLTNLGGIYENSLALFGASSSWWVLIAFFAVAWVLAYFSFFMAVSAISNPAESVGGRGTVNGIFYGGDFYRFHWLSVFKNFRVMASQDHCFQVTRLPKDEQAVIEELVFEKMKLCYIRDLKMKRLHWCINSTLLWVVSGGATWLISLASR